MFFDQDRDNASVKQVREWPVAEIVHQTSNCDIADIVVRYVVVLKVLGEAFVLFADFFQAHHLFLSQMTNA